MLAGLRFVLCLGLIVACTSTAAASTLFDTETSQRRLARFGIVQGEFYPDQDATLTRAELLVPLVRGLDLDSVAALVKGAPSFADVYASDWYSGYVVIMKELEVAVGETANTFGPNEKVSLAEALAFIVRTVRLPQWRAVRHPEDAILSAVDAGVITAAQAQEIRTAGTQVAKARTVLAMMDQIFFLAPYDGGPSSFYSNFRSLIAPTLAVTAPRDGARVAGVLVVEGSVAADQAHLHPVSVSLHVDGVLVGEAVVETAGSWRVEIDVGALDGDSHELVVEATDFAGRKSLAESRAFSVGAPGSGGSGGSDEEGGAGGSGGDDGSGGAGGSAGEAGAGGSGGSAGEDGSGGSAGEVGAGGSGGSAGEAGAGGSGGSGGEGGTGGSGGRLGSGGEGGTATPPTPRKNSPSTGGGCSQGSGASIGGLLLIGLLVSRRIGRGRRLQPGERCL